MSVPRVPTSGVLHEMPGVSMERNVVPAGKKAVTRVPVAVAVPPLMTRYAY